MIVARTVVTAFAATLSVLSSGTLCATPLGFGVDGSPIDISANVSEAILPGGTVFQDSKPVFGTVPDPKQSAQLLHLSDVGFNVSGRSNNISRAFASSLAESDGNGGVGVSQTIFGGAGNQGGSGANVVRQLAAQSLWTQTFLYEGSSAVDVTLHLKIPALEVELLGVPPNRDNPSATETATARASVETVITHPDGSFSHGGSFEFGLREFETQIPGSGSTLLNFPDVDLIGTDGPLFASLSENFDAGRFTIDAVSTDVRLGRLHAGDILAYVYTLTAAGTTHGFERGYDAFLGDPFAADVVGNNLAVTVTPVDAPIASVPEPGTWTLLLLGVVGCAMWAAGPLLRRSRRIK